MNSTAPYISWLGFVNRGDVILERRRGHEAAVHFLDDAVRIDEKAGRQRADLIRICEAAGVERHLIRDPKAFQERDDQLGVFLLVDAQEDHFVFVLRVGFDDDWQLLFARRAPGRERVDEHRLAAVLRERDRLAVDVFERDRRSWLANHYPAARLGAVSAWLLCGAPGGEHQN